MNPETPDDPTADQTGFAAMWSSDGVTRSLAPTGTALPVDLPFLFSGGQHFGPYLIVRPLGKGGMGQVYEAEETDSGRRVAVKILSRGIGDDEERERFLSEGQLAASLSHPNCVYVFGTTEIQGFPVIAMELAPGGTLKELVVPGTPMPMAKAVDAILQVIAGLDAAARIGILHRDIKPSNCFVASDGRVLVGDFGLSIATLARDEATRGVAGTIMGTPGFASPEQLRGEALDVRSDIYSVGATIYYLLTGKAPFDDPNIMTMITRVGSEPAPSITVARPDLPGRLGSVVAKCLAKRPGDRYASYAALSAALEPFRSAAITPAPLGRRFFAGFLDSYIAGLPAVPLNAYFGSIVDARHRTDLLLAQVPMLLIILAYYTLLEGRFGCGAGKAVFNLRVVDETETAPGYRRAFLRCALFVLPAQIMNMVIGYLALPGPGQSPSPGLAPILALVSIVLSFLLLAAMFSTARKRNGYAALHDLATRTRVVVRPRGVEARTIAKRTAAASHPLSAEGARLGPYAIAPEMKSMPITAPTVVHGYDDRLRRGVWIELLPTGAPPLSPHRRDLGRPARSRWLSGRRTATESWDAYEAIEGQPLLEAARTPQPWSRVRHWLSDLSGEIAAGTRDRSLPPLTIDRIWIGSDDRARLLDWSPPSLAAQASAGLRPPSPGASEPASAGLPRPDSTSAQRFLYGIAAGALRGVHPDQAQNEPLAMPLPLPARALLESMRTDASGSLDAVHAQAEAQLRSPAAVTARRRATQVAVSALAPVFFPVVLVGAIYLQQRTQTSNPEAYALRACVGQLSGLEKRSPNLTDKQREQRRLIEIYIAEHLRDEVEESAIVAQRFPVVNRVKGEHELAARAIANHPTRTPEDVNKAEEAVARLIEGQTSSLAKLAAPRALVSLTVIAAAFGSAFVGVLALIGSLVTRGGFTFRPFGAALVRKDGNNASRLRALSRVIVAWSPVPLVCYLVVKGPNPALVVSTGRTLLEVTIYLIFVAGAVWAILHPSRGIQDRIAGTWIVPR